MGILHKLALYLMVNHTPGLAVLSAMERRGGGTGASLVARLCLNESAGECLRVRNL